MYILGTPTNPGDTESIITKHECFSKLSPLTRKMSDAVYGEFFDLIDQLYISSTEDEYVDSLINLLSWAENISCPQAKILVAAVVCESIIGTLPNASDKNFCGALFNINTRAIDLFNETVITFKPKTTLMACAAILAAKEIDTPITNIAINLVQYSSLLHKRAKLPALHN